MKCFCRSALLLFGLGLPIVAQSIMAADGTFAMVALSTDKPLNIKSLHGKWRIDTFHSYDGDTGKVTDFCEFKYTLLIPADNKLIIEIESIKFLEWIIEYDVKKTPVWIDLTPIFLFGKKTEKSKKNKGLVKLEGDSLLIHLSADVRPTDFKQQKELTSMLIRCTRAK